MGCVLERCRQRSRVLAAAAVPGQRSRRGHDGLRAYRGRRRDGLEFHEAILRISLGPSAQAQTAGCGRLHAGQSRQTAARDLHQLGPGILDSAGGSRLEGPSRSGPRRSHRGLCSRRAARRGLRVSPGHGHGRRDRWTAQRRGPGSRAARGRSHGLLFRRFGLRRGRPARSPGHRRRAPVSAKIEAV
jgi:hypothetical protein